MLLPRYSRLYTLITLLITIATVTAQDGYYFHDDFEDEIINDFAPGNWHRGNWAGNGQLIVEDENVLITNCGVGGCALGMKDEHNQWAYYTDVSYRVQGRITEGSGSIAIWGRSLDPRVYYGFVNTRGEHGIGDTVHGFVNTRERLPFDVEMAVDDVVMKLDIIGDEVSFSAWRAGDEPVDLPIASFRDSTLSVGTVGPTLTAYEDPASNDLVSAVFRWMEIAEIIPGDVDTNDVIDVRDIDYLSVAIREGLDNNRYDVDRNGEVEPADRQMLLSDVKDLWIGDADLDGEFNSADLVAVFQAGEYDDANAGNSTWGTGDWDGNGEFDSADFVVAFQDGGYEQGTKNQVASVPEPNSVWITAIGFVGILRFLTRRA